MRSDSNLSKQFSEEGVDVRQYGVMPGVIDTSKKVDGNPVLRSHSFSGKESNLNYKVKSRVVICGWKLWSWLVRKDTPLAYVEC